MTRLVLLVSAACLCVGCAGSVLTSKNEAPEVFRLATPLGTPAGPSLPLALSVAQPRASSALDTNRIAVVKPGLGFDYYAGVRWAETAPQMLQQMLVKSLAADGRFAPVLAAPSRVPADLLLEVELRAFESIYRGQDESPYVNVELQVVLLELKSGHRLVSFPARGQAMAADSGRASLIAAFDEATSTAIATVVTGLRAATPGNGS
jgi:cholesterol transport system auxiliary component